MAASVASRLCVVALAEPKDRPSVAAAEPKDRPSVAVVEPCIHCPSVAVVVAELAVAALVAELAAQQ